MDGQRPSVLDRHVSQRDVAVRRRRPPFTPPCPDATLPAPVNALIRRSIGICWSSSSRVAFSPRRESMSSVAADASCGSSASIAVSHKVL